MDQLEKVLRKKKIRTVIRASVFIAVFFAIFMQATKILANTGDYRNYQWVRGFYGEKKDSLDAVYIGSSAAYSFYQAALGWDSNGIAVWPYATDLQPLTAARFLLEETQKTQPDALKIIDIRSGLLGGMSANHIHWTVDYMPWSMTKLKLIHSFCEVGGYELADRLEFYIPLVRYHSRWKEINKADLSYELDGTKGGSHSSSFLKRTEDVSGYYRENDYAGELPEETEVYLESLFDYIDQEDIPVLFISNTGMNKNEAVLAQINRIMEMAEARGYDTLNLKNRQGEIGIDATIDYYNAGHTNIHGSIKYTGYLASYLAENYGFQDKRGQAGYESWDLAAEKYKEILAPYVVEEELDADAYDSGLQAPELIKLDGSGTNLTLQWKRVRGALAYHIYRKTETTGPWQFLAAVAADTLSYEDTGLEMLHTYTYTVVPQGERDGRYTHGNYSFTGISAMPLPATPELLELTGDDQALTLSWEEVPGAEGYYVYRKIFGRSWNLLADVTEGTAYLDSDLFDGRLPLLYTVRAYVTHEGEQKVQSGFDANGLLYLPQLQDIGLTASAKDGRTVLSWEPVTGAGRYYIERRTEGGDWIQLTDSVSGSVSSVQDLTAESGVTYQYRITAALTYCKEEHRFATQATDGWIRAAQDSVIVDRPEIVFARKIGDGVELVWTPASNVSAYRIYRKTEGADWTVLEESVTGNSYTDGALTKKANEAAYLVQALYGPKGVVFEGEFSREMAVSLGQEG